VEQTRKVRLSDVLIYEAALALWFWLPYRVTVVPDSVSRRWPWIELVWFAAWISSPILTLVGLLAVPRALRVRGGWLQVIVAWLLALSIWYQASRIEF
jgi:hypothetical protein